ncbi:MAG: ATP-binding protein [Muribaculaceae bacterium]|nr:ATP-binding protein [Muribaculaceae bacterium]
MDKSYVKTLIVMRQNEFPVPLYPRENPLPIDLGKIITVPGVRRCGKSSKMEMVVNRLIEDGVAKERILWIGFDDERLYNMTAGELDDIISAYRELYQEIDLRTVYMFFDEIQLIDGWEYFVMRLYKHYTKNIYISGSNATMLSSELKSVLRGWPLEEETYPLSFREFCTFKGINPDSWLEQDIAKIRNAFHDYNRQGGYPEVVLTDNLLYKTKILQGYFETMLLRDMGEHYGISNLEVLRYFVKRILVNLTKPTSVLNIYNDIKSRGLKVSKDDLYRWVDYAKNVFLLLAVPSYSKSLVKRESSQPKLYCIDNGLRDAVLLPQTDDNGKKLENTVFLHLYRERTPIDTIFYYKGKQECDFVLQRGVEVEALFQVCWDLSDAETMQREIGGLIEASAATQCDKLFIITAEDSDTIDVAGRTIRVVPAWKWLLGRL